jgi:hypothetical protein
LGGKKWKVSESCRRLTFERCADALLSVVPPADDGNQIARIEHADETQRKRGD